MKSRNPNAAVHPRGKFLLDGAAAVAAFGILQAPARAAQFEYKSAHPQQVDTPLHVRQVQLWNAVARETNGRLVVRVFPAGQLGGQNAILSQTRLNAIQFVALLNSAYSDIVPVAAIDGLGFAFRDPKMPWTVMNGPLGDYVRKEFEPKGLYIPKGALFDIGMREITAATKPIRSAEDFGGFKIRVPPGKIIFDLFQTLGASPVAMDQTEVYPGLQTHIIDGQETPYLAIYSNRIFEVTKYLSVTNHMWSGEWLVGNLEAWKALPPDIQAIVERNILKYMLLARNDAWRINDITADKLRRVGMTFNTAETRSMRARLGPYYARWKSELGSTAWNYLEASVGKLG